MILPSSARSQSLPDGVASAFSTHGARRQLHRNDLLFSAGDAVTGLYLVISGRMRIVLGTTRSLVLHEEGPGGLMGETALFGGTVFPATAVAAEPCEIWFLATARVFQLLRDDPDAAAYFLNRLASRLGTVIRRFNELGRKTVSARLALHILARHDTRGASEISLGMTQQELAEELGTVREVLVRELRRLVASGVVSRLGRGIYRIEDLVALQSIATPSAL